MILMFRVWKDSENPADYADFPAPGILGVAMHKMLEIAQQPGTVSVMLFAPDDMFRIAVMTGNTGLQVKRGKA